MQAALLLVAALAGSEPGSASWRSHCGLAYHLTGRQPERTPKPGHVPPSPRARVLIFDSANPDPATSNAPYRVFNIGNNRPTHLMDYIEALEVALGVKAIKNYLPMQPGDVPATAANTDELDAWVGFKPNTAVTEGVAQFVHWYRNYYKA